MTERAERIAGLGFDYAAEPKRPVERCNLCGHERFVTVVHRDRYGYDVDAQVCLRCGLAFLGPVMTREAYSRFYVSVYRPLVSAYHGRLIDANTIKDEQRAYSTERIAFLRPFLEAARGGTLMDIGGSTGIVAAALAEEFGLRPTVLDPAPLELKEAHQLGIETVAGFVEDYDPAGRRFDVVTMFQTVDHLLDVAGTLAVVARILADGGVVYADIVDWRAAYLRNRSVEESVKIDHPYYLTEPTFEAYLASAGFDVLGKDYARDHLHIGYVCARAEPVGALPDPEWVASQLREIRAVQNGA